MTRTGLVLAGGRSTRFGGRKALATLDGEPLIRRVAAALAPAVDELVVNCRRDQLARLTGALDGYAPRFALDPVPDEGPASGLLTGLRVASGTYTFVAGCDMPFLRPAPVERLFDRANGATGAAPLVDGRPQPLGLVYRTADAHEACERTLAAGSRRLGDVLARIDPIEVPTSTDVVRDIDTRTALDAAREDWPARSSPESEGDVRVSATAAPRSPPNRSP